MQKRLFLEKSFGVIHNFLVGNHQAWSAHLTDAGVSAIEKHYGKSIMSISLERIMVEIEFENNGHRYSAAGYVGDNIIMGATIPQQID